jgi:hypothetical protein
MPGNQWTRTWSPRWFSPMKVKSAGIQIALPRQGPSLSTATSSTKGDGTDIGAVELQQGPPAVAVKKKKKRKHG